MMRLCPFCGHLPVMALDTGRVDNGEYYVHCTNCRAEGPARPTQGEAERAWNGDRDVYYNTKVRTW